ncbi:MAG: MBL fold metallo-hydrolase [Opitutaceae bacterium]
MLLAVGTSRAQAPLLGALLALLALSVHATPPWDPADVRLVARRLAPGVYAALPDDADKKDHVATTGGIVVGKEGVLIVESMVTGRLAAQLIGLARGISHKPIRYLVNTSYHGDHSYGNYVFPQQTVVIQHPSTKAYIDSKFEQDRAFMLNLMGRGKGIEEVTPRSADITVADWLAVDLGGLVAEVRHFGFGQTPGDLVVWLPVQKVLWTGNLIQAAPPALPWLLEGRHRETIETLKRLQAFLPEDAVIIPGHGRPMQRSDISYAIGYLEELDRKVRAAIATSRSLEDTKQTVTMPEYARYSLFNWVHNEVNLPAVYKALAGPGAAN